ncbi:MAG: T9SS type A sorting domain-containing protein [Flavobacteriales bacterium]|nr:T9SS type A sorting domain-containing protein [Flavobacteriales bacterium]
MKHVLALIGLLLVVTTAMAQPGRLDPGYYVGTGTNDVTLAMALDQDGKTVIGGAFTTYNGTVRNRVARLNTDGSLDLAFDPSSGANDAVGAVAVQSDGKIVIGGGFSSYNGVARSRIARLNSDGTLDAGFEAAATTDQTVRCIAVQPDGKIVIGGTFTHYNGTPANSIARLNADGSQDLSFDPGTGATGATIGYANIYAVALQPDGKIILAGSFSQYNGLTRNGITRINSDGSLDTGFNPQDPDGIGGANGPVNCLALQPDGKILFGGFFTTYNNAPRKYVARLNSDGSLNYAFHPSPGPSNYLECLAVQPDGSIVMGGAFTSYSGQIAYLLTRSLKNGEADPTFKTDLGVTGFGPHIRCVAIQPDGNIVIGGYFSSYQGVPGSNIARVQGDEVLKLTLTTDANASETSWELLAVNDSVLVSGGPYMDGAPMVVKENIPVKAGCYKFRVLDAGGNGMAGGGYVLTNGIGQRIIEADGQFGSVSSTDFKFCLPLGRNQLKESSCDDGQHDSSVPLTCAAQNVSGYQFLFFDPHGSYSRLTSSNGPQVGPNRLGELPVGLNLNVSVRNQFADNSFSAFGPTCKLTMAGDGLMDQELRSAAFEFSSELQTWPNPATGTSVQISLDGLNDQLDRAQLDVYDAVGRQSISTSMPVSNGSLNSVLPLENLTNGLYLVRITAGDQTFNSRLMVQR